MKLRIMTLVCIFTLAGCGGGSSSSDPPVQVAVDDGNTDSELPADTEDTESTPAIEDSDAVDGEDPTEGETGSDTQDPNNTTEDGVDSIDTVVPSSAPFGMVAYDMGEFAGGGVAQSLQVDRLGNIAFYDQQSGQSPVLMAGTLNGITATQSVSSSLLGIEPATQIFSISDLSMAVDRSVALQVRLAGSQPGYALVSWDAQGLHLLVRTGDVVVPVNGPGGKVRSVDTPSRVVGGVYFTVTYDDSSSALLYHNGESITIVAGTRKDEMFAVLEAPECHVFLGPRSLIFNDADPVRIGSDSNSVIFPALFDAACPYDSAIVHYQNGSYSVVLADGQTVPGLGNATFGYQSLMDVAADGSVAVQSVVDRDRTVEQPGVDRGFSVSAWHIPFSEKPELLVVQGESVETDKQQYFLDRNFIFSPAVQFRHAPGGRYALLGEFDSETALFVGNVRDPIPYSSFDTVGASSLQFRISTLSAVPAPYDERAFFRDLKLINVLEGGQLLFESSISTAPQGGRIVSERWISEIDGNVRLIASPSDEIPLTTGGTVKFSSLSFSEAIPMIDGSMLFQSSGYLLRFYPDQE